MGVDGTGSGSCPMMGFGASDTGPSGSARRELLDIIIIIIIIIIVIKLHNEDLHNLYSSPGIIRMTNSRNGQGM
jgi:hypothetical protein